VAPSYPLADNHLDRKHRSTDASVFLAARSHTIRFDHRRLSSEDLRAENLTPSPPCMREACIDVHLSSAHRLEAWETEFPIRAKVTVARSPAEAEERPSRPKPAGSSRAD
jgi:hypothetical protein